MSLKRAANTTSGKDIRKAICNFLCGRLENRHVIFFFIYFAAISILELAAYAGAGEAVTILASRIWLAGGVICAAALLFMFVCAVKTDLLQRNILSLAGLAVLLFYLFWVCGKPAYTDINPDATQQAAAGLSSFLTKDLGYTAKAFLGYPNRQYLLVALPALFFGRSIVTLQLGFAIPFVLGLLSMYSGLRLWLYKKGLDGSYAILGIYAIFAFRYVTEYYINFEQSILPISLTMILIGLFLRFLCSPDAVGIFSIAWIGCLCSNSYTPVLASLGLLLVSLALLAISLNAITYNAKNRRLPFSVENKRQSAIILILADINMALFFFATLLGDRSDRVNQFREDIKYVSLIKTSIYSFLTDKNAVFFGFMGILVLIYLFAALSFQLKLHDFLISLWVLGVFVATNLMEGYTAYAEAWVMQRALLVIPVLITGMLLTCCNFVDKHKIIMKKGILVVMLVALAFLGRYNFMQKNQSFIYFNYVQPMKYMLEDLETTTKLYGISHRDTFNFIIYTDSVYMKNPGDYLQFLYPEAAIYVGTFGEFPEGVDLSVPTIIYGDRNMADSVPASVVQYFTYKNKRYEETGFWYRACILP